MNDSEREPLLFGRGSLEPSAIPSRLSHRRKQEILAELSEAEFRDKVVRAVFLRRGLTFLRDTCGPQEEGKDAIFLHVDPLGQKQVYAVQTKRGRVTSTSTSKDNVTTIVAQLRTVT